MAVIDEYDFGHDGPLTFGRARRLQRTRSELAAVVAEAERITGAPDREEWRAAVRSGEVDRCPHPGDCRCRECAHEEVGEW